MMSVYELEQRLTFLEGKYEGMVEVGLVMLGIIGALLIIIAAFNAWQVRDVAGAKVSKEFEERFGHYREKFKELESEAEFHLDRIRNHAKVSFKIENSGKESPNLSDELGKLRDGENGSTEDT
jgi:hypothetical protein